MASIYEVTGELLALMDMAEQEDMDPQALADTLEGLEGEFDDKVESWVKCIKNLEGEAKAVKDEAKRLADRAKTIENNTKRMKETVLACLKALGKTEAGVLLKAKVRRTAEFFPSSFWKGLKRRTLPSFYGLSNTNSTMTLSEKHWTAAKTSASCITESGARV